MSAEAIRKNRLQRVLESAKKIHSSLDLDAILSEFLELSVEELATDGGTIYFYDRSRELLESRHIISPVEVPQITLKPGEGVAGAVALSGQPRIVEDTSKDADHTTRVDQSSGFRSASTIVFPLKDEQGQVIGVLQLLNQEPGGFSQDDVRFLEDLSIFVALAIRNAVNFQASLVKARMEEEILMAREIHERILPRVTPEVPGFDLHARIAPCYEVGGDYYNVFDSPEGTLVALIDVSGKGVGSAMVAFSIHTFLRLQVGSKASLSEMAQSLNRLMLETFELKKYATGIILRIHPDRHIEYLSAGHPAILHLAGGERHLLGSTSPPIGLLKQAPYRQSEIEVGAGDLLFLSSDGYDETANPEGEEFGAERLYAAIEEAAGSPLASIADNVHEQLTAFQGDAPTGDDRTLILLRAL